MQKIYSEMINKNGDCKTLKQLGYELFAISNNNQLDGFYAIALQRKLAGGNKNKLISISGTEFYDLKDWYNDQQIYQGTIPNQWSSTKTFIEEIIATASPDDKIVLTGQSLGGFLSQMGAAKYGLEAIAFDAPGAAKQIKAAIGDNWDRQKIRIINAFPNLINTQGDHINIPEVIINHPNAKLCLNIRCNIPGTLGRATQPPKYLHSHRMRHILGGISPDNTFERAPINWPKSSLDFYITRATYDAIPKICDRYIYEEWLYLSTSAGGASSPFTLVPPSRFDFIIKYPTFELYRDYFIKYRLQDHQ